MTILENVGLIFACCLWIESRVKDFILLKQNPSFIERINKSKTRFDEDINEKVWEIQKKSFTQKIIDVFFWSLSKWNNGTQ